MWWRQWILQVQYKENMKSKRYLPHTWKRTVKNLSGRIGVWAALGGNRAFELKKHLHWKHGFIIPETGQLWIYLMRVRKLPATIYEGNIKDKYFLNIDQECLSAFGVYISSMWVTWKHCKTLSTLQNIYQDFNAISYYSSMFKPRTRIVYVLPISRQHAVSVDIYVRGSICS